jgi:hypothetical protein
MNKAHKATDSEKNSYSGRVTPAHSEYLKNHLLVLPLGPRFHHQKNSKLRGPYEIKFNPKFNPV